MITDVTRAADPATRRLDFGLDNGNASGIFAMKKAA